MLTVRILLETTFFKYGEIVRDLLNKGLAPTGKSLSEADFRTEFATFSEPAGGGFMFATDLNTPVGAASFRKLQDKTCQLVHYFVADNIDPRTPTVLLEQLFARAGRSGYQMIRISSDVLANRQILNFVIMFNKNNQSTPLEYCPTQEFFDIPLGSRK